MTQSQLQVQYEAFHCLLSVHSFAPCSAPFSWGCGAGKVLAQRREWASSLLKARGFTDENGLPSGETVNVCVAMGPNSHKRAGNSRFLERFFVMVVTAVSFWILVFFVFQTAIFAFLLSTRQQRTEVLLILV